MESLARIKQNMKDYCNQNKSLKYIYFGGKGGVGKTVLAGATAMRFAESGKRTLLASTNPVHSLSNLFQQDLFGSTRQIAGIENFYALEIDTSDTIAKKKSELTDMIMWFLKFADIPISANDFIESATMNPAFEESAMFENMIDIIIADEYDVYVFDTAPAANARRLLGMSKVYSLWVDKMLKSREDAVSIREMLSAGRRKQKEKDPLMEYLDGFRTRIDKVHTIITDVERTAFFFVTLPEALPIAVIKRFIGWFKDFGIPIGGIIVNEVIDPSELTPDSPEFVKNRVAMQNKHLDDIFATLPDVRAILPYFDREVQGIDMLSLFSKTLFA